MNQSTSDSELNTTKLSMNTTSTDSMVRAITMRFVSSLENYFKEQQGGALMTNIKTEITWLEPLSGTSTSFQQRKTQLELTYSPMDHQLVKSAFVSSLTTDLSKINPTSSVGTSTGL